MQKPEVQKYNFDAFAKIYANHTSKNEQLRHVLETPYGMWIQASSQVTRKYALAKDILHGAAVFSLSSGIGYPVWNFIFNRTAPSHPWYIAAALGISALAKTTSIFCAAKVSDQAVDIVMQIERKSRDSTDFEANPDAVGNKPVYRRAMKLLDKQIA